jgi:NOL1/NOP2/fmu family ribosome biogenesis protein
MNWLKILSVEEKKVVKNLLKKQFGIETVPGLMVKKGQERIFLFIGKLHPRDIKNVESGIIIERVGIYFAKIENNEIRLSIEGTQLLKNQISKNIFELNDEQLKQWMTGNQLDIATGKKGFLIMKYKDDFLGCGKASAEKISNFVPKTRRLRQKG